MKKFLPMMFIEAKNISDAWFQLVYNILQSGKSYIQHIQRGSYEKVDFRYQYAGVAVSIEFPWLDMLPQIPEGMMDDKGNKIPPPADMKYLETEYFPNYIMGNELQPNETYTYGTRLNELIPYIHPDGHMAFRSQFDEMLAMLKKTPLTNHAVIEIAKPSDITLCIGKDGKNDPPCMRLIDFKVIPVVEGCDCDEHITGSHDKTCRGSVTLVLTVSVYFRSWDLWGGFPVNLGAVELLKQLVAQECGFENGAMYAYSSGLHVYGKTKAIAEIRAGKKVDLVEEEIEV